jgi:hypothetical protein
MYVVYAQCTVFIQGSAVVEEVFHFTGKVKRVIAGLSVKSGLLSSGKTHVYKIIRNGEVILENKEKGHLQVFKDEVKEVLY